MSANRLGRSGERRVTLWHRLRGYRILATGFTARRGELDLVALKRQTLHIVEVKTRTVGGEAPAAALTPEKRRRIVFATAVFCRRTRIEWRRLSFDLAEVHVGRWRTTVVVHRDVFRAEEVERERH